MHRFYLPPERCAGDRLSPDSREAHHALHVLRLRSGDAVQALDGAGHVFACAVETAARGSLVLRVMQKEFIPPAPCSITLLQAVPKGKIIEDIIQKAVELGVRRIVPLLTEHVVTRLDARERMIRRNKWQQVAIEAIKQCGAAWPPEIAAPTPLAGWLRREPAADTDSAPAAPAAFELALVGSLQTERRHPRDCFGEFEARFGRPPESVGVWIGPEGDFTRDELEAIQATGAQPITLGRLVLRVETAALYCLSILNYELNSGRA